MKCPKCGYHSFEHLDNCRKCGQDLHEHKAKYNVRGFMTPAAAAPTATPAEVEQKSAGAVESSDHESIDFGFDFLEEDENRNGASPDNISLGGDDQGISLDQPFDADSEDVPADIPTTDKGKPEKGPEYAF